MRLSVEHYSQQNITWDAAKRVAAIITDAFQKDFIRVEFYPKRYNFSQPLPEICDYKELIDKARAFEEVLMSTARQYYCFMRSDNHAHIFLFKELEGHESSGGQEVGLSLWRLPKYVHVNSKVSLLHKLKTWLLSVIFRLQEWWTFGSAGSPLNTPALLHEFDLGYKHCNIKDTPESISDLESLSGEELAKVPYPASYSYRLSQFCVCSAAQGKGYGRFIMDESIARLRQMGIQDPPNLRGPAKIGFFSAPDARQFYKKCGFSVGATWDHKVPSGRTLPHTYFFMNLT